MEMHFFGASPPGMRLLLCYECGMYDFVFIVSIQADIRLSYYFDKIKTLKTEAFYGINKTRPNA